MVMVLLYGVFCTAWRYGPRVYPSVPRPTVSPDLAFVDIGSLNCGTTIAARIPSTITTISTSTSVNAIRFMVLPALLCRRAAATPHLRYVGGGRRQSDPMRPAC